MSYYEMMGATTVVKHFAVGSRDGGTHWTAAVQLTPNTPTPTEVATDRDLGEYDEIVAMPLEVLPPAAPNPPPAGNGLAPTASGYQPRWWPGAFYASWSNGDTVVFAAGYSPP